MSGFGRHLLFAGLFCLAAASWSHAQDLPAGPTVAQPAESSQPSGASVPAVLTSLHQPGMIDGMGALMHSVRLQVDGNLVGRVRTYDAQGNLSPAAVRVFFVQSSQIVAQTLANENGDFQVPGLQPGIYSVIAAGEGGFGAFSVRILPYDPTAPAEVLELDGTLIPPSDFAMLGNVLGQQLPGLVQPPVPPPPFAGGLGGGVGGGGGGGGGLGAIGAALGAAGLGAGLAALADDDDEPVTVTIAP